MADIFDELLGGGAPAPELIAALRRQRSLGQVGALSGDKNISRLGGSVYDDSMKQATDVRDRRDADAARKSQQAFAMQQQEQASADRKARRDYQYAALRQAAELARAQNKNALDIASLRESGDKETAQAAAGKQRAQQLNKLEAALRTSGIGNVWSAMQGARGVVDKYTDKDAAGNVTGYRGVPGVGGLANARTLGAGALAATLGNWGKEEDGTSTSTTAKENQSKIAALQNLVLQARSGAAVTDPELQRMLTETGLTTFSSDEDFLRAFPRLMQKAEESVRNTLAGYDPEVVDEFLRRGGLPGFKGVPDPEQEMQRVMYGEGQ